MGNPEYSKPKEEKSGAAVIGEAFVAWFNALEFNNDTEAKDAIIHITNECEIRLASIEEEMHSDK